MARRQQLFNVDLEPLGRHVGVAPGVSILSAAREAGVQLASACGGHGTCGLCRVRVTRGSAGVPSECEHEHLGSHALADGIRLACQATVQSDVRLDIPPDSLSTEQRIQLEGVQAGTDLEPAVVALDVVVPPPGLDDLRSDAARLLDAVAPASPGIGLSVLSALPEQLRTHEWAVRVVLHRPRDEIVSITGVGSPMLGLAVDLGTTKVAAYLVDLETGETLARAGAMNLQIAHGEDVLSRIAFANTSPAARHVLQAQAIDVIDQLTEELCTSVGRDRDAIVDSVIVGNTAMHHLVAGLPVRQLGQAPYVAACSAALELRAADLGLRLSPGATVYVPPVIAGYVGADHVAMLLATGMAEVADRTVLALDVGTNTEISLASEGRLWSCSTASGPAFEGAHISNGMRAAPGAIERVHYRDGTFTVQTVEDRPPLGICGSGILDAVAEGLDGGIIDARGAFVRSHPLVRREDGHAECVLVPALTESNQREIVFTRADVGEVQLAKGAIHAGTELLLEAAGIGTSDLDEVVVAGAFGTYLDIRSATRVGLLPRLVEDRFRQVGNAAGAGAQRLLLNLGSRQAAGEIARRAQYLELTTHPAFADRFAEAMRF